ncbi:hypothetical protein [Amycolatopsis sp. TNS106]|uniref:hypothetical protein n=1 Tax=Amycolatopsis sp. TNS106 TaxID=2861750 RepID=UPI001C57BC91|nr:hypothetical protein [Amycolatopsis sp. TNS106]QXV57402.1 hypothetical protein CVV72_10620 [Amycolatopsis sp. TNS106]
MSGPSKVTTLLVNERDAFSGTAQLIPAIDPTDGHTVLIVSIDAQAAEFFGIPQPVTTIGGIVRMSGRWAPTAYRDRAHLLEDAGLVYFLPNVPSRVRAVRALLRWWHVVARRTREGDDPRHLDPYRESPTFRRWLLA